MMLNTTKLYNLTPVCMTLVFTQCHRVTEKLELLQSLRCKVALETQMFVMVGYGKKTVKKS